MKTPYLEIDLNKIENNAVKLKEFFSIKNVDIVFITKGTCANLDIIERVNKCGIDYFGDSRMDNIIKVKHHFPKLHFTLIRIPKHSELDDVLKYANCSLQSELSTIEKLSTLALDQDIVHDIILMVDVGDLREGVLVDDVIAYVKEIQKQKGVKLVGIGTNVGCYGSIIPSIENTEILVELKEKIEEVCNLSLQIISGGSTCTTDLLFNDLLHPKINSLRIGEAIMFGEDSTNDKKIDGLVDDAFIINTEIIELKNKPSYPIGKRGKDAFGQVIEYVDYGNIDRAILAIGRQDIAIDALEAIDNRIKVLGGSSDHMIVDVTSAKGEYKVGDIIKFKCSYSAVLMATTSAYVDIKIKK